MEMRRKRRLARCAAGPLHDYLATPFVDPARECREVEYIALDLETTGLDPQKDQIISFGYLLVRGVRIELGSARHRVIRQACAIPAESAVIHGITDDQAAEGHDLEEVLTELLQALTGRVLIAHHAMIELGFIGAACQRLYGGELLLPAVDTLGQARAAMLRANLPIRGGELRLAALRDRYNLPRYPAHNALSDALAAAELFAAQIEERAGKHKLPLKALLMKQ